jgi:hypothetical protein
LSGGSAGEEEQNRRDQQHCELTRCGRETSPQGFVERMGTADGESLYTWVGDHLGSVLKF